MKIKSLLLLLLPSLGLELCHIDSEWDSSWLTAHVRHSSDEKPPSGCHLVVDGGCGRLPPAACLPACLPG
ncbi:hypothetical protein AWZ03_012536 [Drosophila navojoa]|uniref:Uncharacterized protein n=1 Tax=Drosophila navojoa TaxID=7232 RepID=A0A484AZK2_DRONA|nr:hypothetical protein AWZ03_012536 [Drosophila navojoa]